MIDRLRTYASFVRVSHSVFALPFALVGALLATRVVPWEWSRALWIVACMVTARSAAMGFNRLADAAFDARNPRTAMRELPQGRMSRREAAAFVVVSSLVFVFCAWKLGPLCFALSPVALAIVFWYSLATAAARLQRGGGSIREDRNRPASPVAPGHKIQSRQPLFSRSCAIARRKV
jgi:4-hydroxybenzoate polyprenyltransferase